MLTEIHNNLETYDLKKEYFEKFISKTHKNKYVYELDDQYKKLLWSQKELMTAFKHLNSGIFKKGKEQKFLTIWKKDSNKKFTLINNL